VPQIKIISPTDNQTILGDKITISFIVGDFSVGQDGYLNLWLDNPKEEASTAAKITSQFDYNLMDLPMGLHKMTLEAVKSNNISFSPKVKQSVSFTTVLPQVPTITLSPTPNNMPSLGNLYNWQHILLLTALVIIVVGCIIKFIWGRSQIWEN